jgi:hypothetical protein
MLEAFVFILLLVDVFLVWSVFKSGKRQDNRLETLEAIAEEKRMISEMLDNLRYEVKISKQEMEMTLENVKLVAAELDHEIKNYQNSIGQDVLKIESEIRDMLEKPIHEIAQKQIQLKKMYSKIERQKEVILKVINKGEKICQFMDDRISYEELLVEINDKKYSDARALLAKGRSPKEVALDLGLSESEVKLVAGLAI